MKIKKKKLTVKIKFDKKVAIRLSNTSYYKAMEDDIKNLPQRDKEKIKYATSHKKEVTELIKKYKEQLANKSQGVWAILQGIYRKNRLAAGLGYEKKNRDLIGLVSSVPMLMTAYKTIRKNKGATTLAAQMCRSKFSNLTIEQKRFVNRTAQSPDRISRQVIETTSKLLKQGMYPWGSSRRIYIDKPGQPDVKRPITIPPFMDRIVQEAIRFVLEAIYEPYFEKRNRSFGFRVGKGCHDNIYCLTRSSNNGFYTAIEGDIKSAYDKVCRKKLIEILGKKIEDRKFLKLIEERLDYNYLDTKLSKYIKEEHGIPQGGIDSPYLWNIYMMEFDEYVHKYVGNLFNEINKKVRGNLLSKTDIYTKERSAVMWQLTKNRNIIKQIRVKLNGIDKENQKQTKEIIPLKGLTQEQSIKTLREHIHKIRKLRHTLRQSTICPNHRNLRFTYTRYADDWILTGNFTKLLAEKIKKELSLWLQENLKATLSVEKTLITDMRKQPAHFLGFQLMASESRKLGYVTTTIAGKKVTTLRKVAGQEIRCLPDKERLINRLYMKGYCDKKGFPREMPWLSTLEAFTIIERYNAVLRGMANYYGEFISTNRSLYRWLYIVKYSCLKTLAQKYKTSISKIFKSYRAPGTKTIEIKVTHNFGKRQYEKTWRLLTETEAIIRSKNTRQRNYVINTFEATEKGIQYESNIEYRRRGGATPRIVHENFLDEIRWVNLRSSASLDLPCWICGSKTNVEMHHLNHIRKRKYSTIPDIRFWEKVMALRNRKQVPVCSICHQTVIHTGQYTGPPLKKGATNLKETRKGYDNRLMHLENFINPSKEEFYAKSLEEKGWKAIPPKKDKEK
uniref:Reverse transcriptase domain-containing protein n=1 Tax=Stephanosphaera pluvialis TaxID=51712 RepID=A0A0S2IDR2_9CHLO|nr:hypothetical protein [Stephanosphaera pluvialis]